MSEDSITVAIAEEDYKYCEHMPALPWIASSYIVMLDGKGSREDYTVYDKECPLCDAYIERAVPFDNSDAMPEQSDQ